MDFNIYPKEDWPFIINLNEINGVCQKYLGHRRMSLCTINNKKYSCVTSRLWRDFKKVYRKCLNKTWTRILNCVHVNSLFVMRAFSSDNLFVIRWIKCDARLDTIRKHATFPFCKATFCTVLWYTVKCSLSLPFSCFPASFAFVLKDEWLSKPLSTPTEISLVLHSVFLPVFWILLF